MKKYYLRHKYLTTFNDEDCNYLNWDLEYERLFLEDYASGGECKTQFTDDDIEHLVQKHRLNLMDWIKEEVEEEE